MRQPAWVAEAATRMRAKEDEILRVAKLLDPADDRLEARQLRECAASIQDHRDAEMEA